MNAPVESAGPIFSAVREIQRRNSTPDAIFQVILHLTMGFIVIAGLCGDSDHQHANSSEVKEGQHRRLRCQTKNAACSRSAPTVRYRTTNPEKKFTVILLSVRLWFTVHSDGERWLVRLKAAQCL